MLAELTSLADKFSGNCFQKYVFTKPNTYFVITDCAVLLTFKLLCAICCGTQKAEVSKNKTRSFWAPNSEEAFRGIILKSKVT